MTEIGAILTEIEEEIKDMRNTFRERNKQITARIDKVLAIPQGMGTPLSIKLKTAEATESKVIVKNKKKSMEKIEMTRSPLLCLARTRHGSQCVCIIYSGREIDQKLGGFYGSNDLRDSIKDAMNKIQTTVPVLQKVRDNSHSPFIRKEIEHALKNLGSLSQVFNRLVDRMEIPDCEQFFLEDKSDAERSKE